MTTMHRNALPTNRPNGRPTGRPTLPRRLVWLLLPALWQVLALPTVTGLPVTVLSAAQPMKETSDLAKFSNALREDIARLYPNARQVWVDSGHAIPLEKPEAVVNAITAALAEARAGR